MKKTLETKKTHLVERNEKVAYFVHVLENSTA